LPALAVLVCATLACLTFAAAAPAREVPRGFIGVMADGPLLEHETLERAGTSLGHEMDLMVRAGVESIRLSFSWARVQPYRSWNEVPPSEVAGFRDSGGVPTDFRATDRTVRMAAERGLSLLPVVLEAPAWAARRPGEFASPPADPRTYAAFLGALAARYGSNGSYWREHAALRRVPLTEWQLWNEPTLVNFWLDQPFASDYVRLLRESRRALRRADPQARIVLAGLVYESWDPLDEIYRAGGRRWFDAVALHPFTRRPGDVLRIVERNRTVMARHGDSRKAIYLSELSWPSAVGRIRPRFGYETDERGQARRLTRALGLLARHRHRLRIRRVYWYTWLTRETSDYPFDYAGLRRLERGGIRSKPAFRAYRRTALRLEGCRKKRRLATRCG
jgi:hypothetical protein